MSENGKTLTVRALASILGLSERSTRERAAQLGGTRPLNARAWRFPVDGLRERIEQAGLVVPANFEQEVHKCD